jgi:hypothetical protein
MKAVYENLVETCRRFASLMDVVCRSRFTSLTLLCLLGCGASTQAPARPSAAPPAAPVAVVAPIRPDPDLHRPPPRRLLDIDWTKVTLTDDAAAIALWRRIAPTGADWDDKLQEVPAAAARPLALALLRGGNFTCTLPPTGPCARPLHEVERPSEAAGFDDPCLRRMLALWSLDWIDVSDLPSIKQALLGIAAIPPPESQLLDAAIEVIPSDDHDTRLELLAVAARAGQHEIVDAAVHRLGESHLITAARVHHIAGAFDALAAASHRAVFLGALTDEALAPRSRTAAIIELVEVDGTLAPDLLTALLAAARSKDCTVAATAARVLEQHGNRRFVPARPRTRDVGQLMRAMCVLASYETLQRSDEDSLLASYLPAHGLQRVTITYDPLSEVDSDGDGDPHTTQVAELLPPGDAVLPQIEDLVKAMRQCTGAICVSDDHEYRFVWTRGRGAMMLSRIEIADRPPCTPAKP